MQQAGMASAAAGAAGAAAPTAAAPKAPSDAKVAAMRAAMAAADGGRGVQAFIVPSEDPHMVSLFSDKRYSSRASDDPHTARTA